MAWHWEGSPKVFLHGYHSNPALYARYIDFQLFQEKIEGLIEEYELNAFLLKNLKRKRSDLPVLYKYLLDQPDWRLVLRDPASVLFLKHSFWGDRVPVKEDESPADNQAIPGD